MSIDTKSQVRAYADFLDSTLPVLEAGDAMVELIGDPPVQPVQERPIRPRQLRREPLIPAQSRWGLRGALAAFMVVLLIGGVAWLERGSPDNDVIDQPTVWSRVSQDEAVFEGEGHTGIGSVTVGGPGLVAVGGDEKGGAVWASVDGVAWSRVPHDEEVFGGDVTMVGVAAGGPGLVAVGWEGSTFDDIPASDAVVWTSVDGLTWSRVPHDEEVFGGSFMTRVTAGGPGLVAVGMHGPPGDGDAAIWTSVDGVTWSRVPHDEAVFGGVDRQVIHDVTVGGPGLVAVGNDGGRGWWDNNPENHPAVWTSVDGLNWTRVPDDEAAFGSEGNAVMLGITAGGPGLVAVGADWWPPGEAMTPIWTSPDGVNWTRIRDDETVRGAMTGVTAGGHGLVAVGVEWSSSETLTVWTSVDGITWAPVPHEEGLFGSWPGWITDVTVGGPGLVAVGYDEVGVAAVWVSPE